MARLFNKPYHIWSAREIYSVPCFAINIMFCEIHDN